MSEVNRYSTVSFKVELGRALLMQLPSTTLLDVAA